MTAAAERRDSYLQGCAPKEVTQVPVDGPTPMHTQAAIRGFSGPGGDGARL